MQFGASVWTFSWMPPYDNALVRIAQLGYKAAELIAWNRETLKEYYTPATIRALKQLLTDQGLELSEFVSTPRGLASAAVSERDAAVDHFQEMVEVALALGTHMVNSVAPNAFNLAMPRILDKPAAQEWGADLPKGLNWEENWKVYAETTARCCEICEANGVRWALEPHPYRWIRNAASMMRLIDHVQSPALGMNFDPRHLFPSGEISEQVVYEQVVYELGGRVFHAHFSGNDGQTNAHWRPGKGKIDWTAVMAALQDTDFTGTISVELEDVPGTANANGGTATEAFDREMDLSLQYLVGICSALGIPVR